MFVVTSGGQTRKPSRPSPLHSGYHRRPATAPEALALDRADGLTLHQHASLLRLFHHSLGSEFGLQRGRVQSVGVEALPDDLGAAREGGEVVIGHDEVRRDDRLVLVDPPDVKLVNRVDAGDLCRCQLILCCPTREWGCSARLRDLTGWP